MKPKPQSAESDHPAEAALGRHGAARGSEASMERAKGLCQCAEHTLESAWLGASKGDIDWALTKAETAVKTLKRAKKLMPQNVATVKWRGKEIVTLKSEVTETTQAPNMELTDTQKALEDSRPKTTSESPPTNQNAPTGLQDTQDSLPVDLVEPT